MGRQILRLILYVLICIKKFVSRNPGGSLGFFLGGLAGYVLSVNMIRFGFPKWVLPVQTLMWAVFVAPVVKSYIDKLKG